jgi:predicted phosphodiesterase
MKEPAYKDVREEVQMGVLDIFKGITTGEVKSVSRDFDADKLLLIPLGDVHLGSPTCNVDKFERTIDFIRRTNCYVILMGDLMEAASKSSVGAGWVEQTVSPQKQLDSLEDALEPIRNKILLVLEGNHEDRIWKDSGIRVMKILAKTLRVPFGGYSAFLKLRVGKNNYIIHAQHGSSNAWYPHTKLTAAMRTAAHTDADLYLYGHTHELLSIKVPRRSMSKRDRIVETSEKYFVLTGSFLEYEGSYAQKKNMYPIQTGIANITLSGKHWDIHCSV